MQYSSTTKKHYDRIRGHELLPAHLRAKLPALYAVEEQGVDMLAQVKLFTPDSNWTWYISEFDGEDICFGLVAGHAVELGYFSLLELECLTGLLGLPVERDRHFQPQSLRELRQQYEPARQGGAG